MKSASNFWIFLILISFFFNCGTQKPGPKVVPMQKAYVLLRTEGSEKEINELITVLNSNFVNNKIASDIKYYAPGRTWNINQIFTTSYNNHCDYIVLIDQVARFTIDKKTNIGSKYQIRKYHIKSSNPDWVDLGQKTCNISVRPSIDKFSEQIISEIVPNYVPSRVSYKTEESSSIEKQTGINAVDYNRLQSEEEIEKEISKLKKELEKEKERTKKAIAEKEKLKQEFKKEIKFQKEKNQYIVEGLRTRQRKREIEEEEQGQEETLLQVKNLKEDIAIKNLATDNKQIEDKHSEEIKKKEETLRLQELEKKNLKQQRALARKNRKAENNKNKAKDVGIPEDRSNALLIIRGQDENYQLFRNLQENLEFELLFSDIKTSSQILNTKKAFDKERILNWNKSKYNYLILINQMGEKENGESVFKISIHSEATNSEWKELDEIPCDLSNGQSLKELSDAVLKSL